MDKFKVLTLIRGDYKFQVPEEYILGKIAGIGYMICGQSRGYTMRRIKDKGAIYEKEFTVDEYDNFMNIIEELYPGLCEFNYQVKNKEESI